MNAATTSTNLTMNWRKTAPKIETNTRLGGKGIDCLLIGDYLQARE